MYGAREPMIIALVAGGLATALSVLIGVSAAYLGGWIDDVLSMVTNIVLVIPQLPADDRGRRLLQPAPRCGS